jgi:hypothetical protein
MGASCMACVILPATYENALFMPDAIWAWALGDRGFYLYSGSSAFHECEITATDFSSLGKECL